MATTMAPQTSQSHLPARATRWPLVALVAYPLAVHGGVVTGFPEAGAAVLLGILSTVLFSALRRRALLRWLIPVAVAGALLAGMALGWSLEALYVPPVVVPLLLCTLFGASLAAGRTPLITELALRMGEADTPRLRAYTRNVTRAWCALFLGLALQAALLAALAPATLWSLFTNGINYALIGLFFLVEFRLRDHFLPGHRYRSLVAFLKALVHTPLRRS